jgi:hypothetical protein
MTINRNKIDEIQKTPSAAFFNGSDTKRLKINKFWKTQCRWKYDYARERKLWSIWDGVTRWLMG